MVASTSVSNALELFISQWMQSKQDSALIDYDPSWPSECYIAPLPSEGSPCHWQPVKRQTHSDMFKRLSQALEIYIHPDLEAYYTTFFSNHMEASAPQGELTLLQVWNEEDLERLRGNLIGHALSKVKQKQPLSFFFAVTEPDDGILSIRNDDGCIWLEYPGKKPVKKIADNLSDFLHTLKPR